MEWSVATLEDRLSRPRPELIEDLRELGKINSGSGATSAPQPADHKINNDLIVLGAAGKMGPSLVRLAARAIAEAGTGATVYAVSRFSTPGSADAMRQTGATVITADIADESVLADLPDAANVIHLVGSKFGTVGHEAETWATNTYLPGRVAERFAGARIVALSTGNVYPLSSVEHRGRDGTKAPTEEDPVGPVGEYAMSCLGRERVLTHVASRTGSPLSLIRLNYAVEARYGVLVDIAGAVRSGAPVDLTMGYVNVIWQGYANEVILRSLLHAGTPPFVINLTGTQTLSVRDLAQDFARRFDVQPTFAGTEADTALLSDASRCHRMFGPPDMSVDDLTAMISAWFDADLPLLGKPTRFESRDGRF